jgi:hypothetical protein
VGQPAYDASCCCTCNEIAKVTTGNKNIDCAYATLKDKVAFFPKVKRIKRGDGTVEDEGLISGTATAVINQAVHKVGYKTGLTRGTVSMVLPRVEVDVAAGCALAIAATRVGRHRHREPQRGGARCERRWEEGLAVPIARSRRCSRSRCWRATRRRRTPSVDWTRTRTKSSFPPASVAVRALVERHGI